VRSVLRMSAIEFRLRYDGDGMLECFREHLILPHRTSWRTFDPLGRLPIGERQRYRREQTLEVPGDLAAQPSAARSGATASGVGQQREDL
jgi:hypothetical protein